MNDRQKKKIQAYYRRRRQRLREVKCTTIKTNDDLNKVGDRSQSLMPKYSKKNRNKRKKKRSNGKTLV